MKKKLKKYFKGLLDILKKPEMAILPGNLAFYFLVSIIPIASLTFYIFSCFSGSVDFIGNFVKSIFSTDVVSMLNPLFLNNKFSINSLFFILFAFFIASNGADAIIVASNNIFNIPNKQYIPRRLKAFFITLLLILLFAFILFVPLLGEQIINMIHISNIKNVIVYSFKILYPVLRIPLSIIIVFGLIKLVYKIAPDENINPKNVNKGAIFTTVMWLISTYIYSLYINSGVKVTYSVYYGSLANLVIVLMWFYLLAYIFVLGLIMNYRTVNKEIEKTNSFKFKELNDKMYQINSINKIDK